MPGLLGILRQTVILPVGRKIEPEQLAYPLSLEFGASPPTRSAKPRANFSQATLIESLSRIRNGAEDIANEREGKPARLSFGAPDEETGPAGDSLQPVLEFLPQARFADASLAQHRHHAQLLALGHLAKRGFQALQFQRPADHNRFFAQRSFTKEPRDHPFSKPWPVCACAARIAIRNVEGALHHQKFCANLPVVLASKKNAKGNPHLAAGR